jgi:hypothetical protein
MAGRRVTHAGSHLTAQLQAGALASTRLRRPLQVKAPTWQSFCILAESGAHAERARWQRDHADRSTD